MITFAYNKIDIAYDIKNKSFAIIPTNKKLKERKINFLKNNNFDSVINYKKKYSGRLTTQSIINAISNTNQLVFEVTEECNLSCEYCAYSEIYKGKYQIREGKSLSFQKAKNIIDYLFNFWDSKNNLSLNKDIFISFYGGEPLLKIKLISSIINYIESKNFNNFNVLYSMTTNGLLLKRNITFLKKYDFNLLISLDGDKSNNSYRVFNNGKESFEKVIDNLDYVYKYEYDFFVKRINFNSVLHNKNTVENAVKYINKRYNKIPNVSELNYDGISEKEIENFWEKYSNSLENFNTSEDYRFLTEQMFEKAPNIQIVSDFIHGYTNNVYKDYLDFFNDEPDELFLPTGTCIPFSRKLFVTASGEILACESIDHKYSMGSISERKIEINFEDIKNIVNIRYNKIQNLCSSCYNAPKCKQCIYYLNIEDETVDCKGYTNKKQFTNNLGNYFKFLEIEDGIYKKIINDIYYE